MIKLEEYNASLLHDAYERHFGANSSRRNIIRTLKPAGHTSFATGRAYTLRLTRTSVHDAPGRHTIMSRYDHVPAGAILVIQVVGDPGGGVVGDLVAHRLSAIGVGGVVVDGPVRDVQGIASYQMPVWCRELTVSGMVASELIAEADCQLTIDGVTINSGDLVSADIDGIYVVAQHEVNATLASARALVQEETQAHERLATGASIIESYPGIRRA